MITFEQSSHLTPIWLMASSYEYLTPVIGLVGATDGDRVRSEVVEVDAAERGEVIIDLGEEVEVGEFCEFLEQPAMREQIVRTMVNRKTANDFFIFYLLIFHYLQGPKSDFTSSTSLPHPGWLALPSET